MKKGSILPGALPPVKGKMLIAVKYFGWWFAWGVFSAIMVFIVLKGGSMALQKQLAAIFGMGVVSGLAGLFWYLNRSRS